MRLSGDQLSGHFSLDCDPGELSAAEAKLGVLCEHLDQEAARLAALGGDSSGWTGAAATACLGETVTISTTMKSQAPRLTLAVKAVRSFRMALETAQDGTLPRLNSRWEQSGADFDDAGIKAGRTYANEVKAYRNAPAEDAGPGRAAAAVARDQAVHNASVAQAGERKGLNDDYDAMFVSLEQAARVCGAAMAGAAPITFTADQWAKVKGGNIPMGMLMSLRSKVFGKDSFVHQSDGVRAAEYVAGRIADEARNGEPGDGLDPEVVALMDQMKGDEAFAQALLTDLGPGGAAFLSLQARDLFESPREDEGKEPGRQLIGILTDLYATGSRIRVPTEDGQSRPLMDNEWLDGFNPEAYAEAGERYKNRFSLGTFVHGYRPDLLLPFMNKARGFTLGFSSDFSQLVGQRALEDYKKAKDLGDNDQAANQRWGLYRGVDSLMKDATTRNAVIFGDSSNPFRTELFHIALDRVAEHPSASNAVMTTHRDTMLQLMTGKDDWLTGGENRHDWASPALAAILKQATVGTQGGNIALADAALWGVADYLKKHPDEHMVKNVQIALGDVVTDKRFMEGVMSSVTSPFGADGAVDGFRDDPNHPDMGPLMHRDLWAALHQEAMRQPDTAAKIIAQVGTYVNDKRGNAQDLGIRWDKSAVDGKGGWVEDRSLTSLDLYQAEAARHFLGGNLKAASGAIQVELEQALAEHGKQKDLAKDILGSMVGLATDPASIVGDVGGRLTEFAVDSAVEAAMPTRDIHAQYDKQIKSLDTMLDEDLFKTDYWSNNEELSKNLIERITHGKISTEVEGLPPGVDDPNQAAPRTYDGDPLKYIGHVSGPPQGGFGPPQTDDFLTYGTNGPNGLQQTNAMNPAQREAYMKWLHDPAVQRSLGAAHAADVLARGENPSP